MKPTHLGPDYRFGVTSLTAQVLLGISVCGGPSVLHLLGRPAHPLEAPHSAGSLKMMESKWLILLEKHYFVLCLVKFLSIRLFYKFPSSQFPQTTKLQFAG